MTKERNGAMCAAVIWLALLAIVAPASAQENSQIFFWDGTTTTQISRKSSYNFDPAISGSKVVWEGFDGDSNEIFYWDGSSPATPFEIPTTSTSNRNADISGANVVWQGWDGDNWRIYMWDGTSVSAISDAGMSEFEPAVSGSNATWRNDAVFFWNGDTATEISVPFNRAQHPAISGSNVVWEGLANSGNFEIYLWDGATTSRISNLGGNDWQADIDGSRVVWSQQFSGIWLWDGSTATRIVDDSTASNPAISGSRVVWQAWDGHDLEIYMWDGSFPIAPVQITHNDTDDRNPDISGQNVVWSGVPAPQLPALSGSGLLVVTTLLGLGGWRSLTLRATG